MAELARAAMYTCATAAIAAITGAVVLGLIAGRGQRRRRFVAARDRVFSGSVVIMRGAMGIVIRLGTGYFGHTQAVRRIQRYLGVEFASDTARGKVP